MPLRLDDRDAATLATVGSPQYVAVDAQGNIYISDGYINSPAHAIGFAMLNRPTSPEAAVDELISLHDSAATSLKRCLDRYFETREPPTAAERKGCPADDLISVWAGVDMDPMSMMHETGLFIAGGAETTRTAIAHGLRVFADHPDQGSWTLEDLRQRIAELEGQLRQSEEARTACCSTTRKASSGTPIRSSRAR